MLRFAVIGGAALLLTLALSSEDEAGPLAIVSHLTRVKIVESNMASVRPGSVYENRTYFESLFGFPRPGFNYRFVDTGLGSAEPLYPLYQKGYQGSWFQLIGAFFGESFSRHIDHYTSLPSIEGCHVDSIYMLRNISEFPQYLYEKEREEGFKQIVIRLEYYTRLKPDAECGRHRSNAPDPRFSPMDFLKSHTKARTLADFPPNELARFEAHIAAIRHLQEEFSRTKWPRFDMNDLKTNSLWYYPKGFAEDYDIKDAKKLVYASTPAVRAELNLSHVVSNPEYQKMLDFLNGQSPAEADEPGGDTHRLEDVTEKNVLTKGRHVFPIHHIVGTVENINNFDFVGMTAQPAVDQDDIHFNGLERIPQLRLVFQLKDPDAPGEHFEQLYYHLNFDVVDRLAAPWQRENELDHFLKQLASLHEARESRASDYDALLLDFIREFTQRPVHEFSFSSALTGPWIFGSLSRAYNEARELRPVRIKRQGVDVGYYSSVNDNELFRKSLEAGSLEDYVRIKSVLDDLWVSSYRDPKRFNVERLKFQRLTCAQCHHMAGRDAVHMAFNDGIDRRIPYPMRATEFVYREAARQLKFLESR